MRADRRVAVLGLMAEIEDPEPAHREIAASARSLGIELFAVGTDLYGIEPLDSPEAAIEAVGPIGPYDVVLVKASRSAGLERVVAALLSLGVGSAGGPETGSGSG
jgi:UDP-N-acetylmuramoyl-tripeptide--D-alanyl-D-alanine ligase